MVYLVVDRDDAFTLPGNVGEVALYVNDRQVQHFEITQDGLHLIEEFARSMTGGEPPHWALADDILKVGSTGRRYPIFPFRMPSYQDCTIADIMHNIDRVRERA